MPFSSCPWVREAIVGGIVVRVAQGSRIKIGFSSVLFKQIPTYNGNRPLLFFRPCPSRRRTLQAQNQLYPHGRIHHL